MWFLTLLNDEKEQRRFDKTLEVQKMEDKVKTESHIFQCCSVEHAVKYENKADPWVVYSTILSTNMYGVPVNVTGTVLHSGCTAMSKRDGDSFLMAN